MQCEDSAEYRRISLISLTTAGERLVEDIFSKYFAHFASLMGVLTPSERKNLVALLMKMHAGLPAFRGA